MEQTNQVMEGHWNLYGPSIEEIRAAIESYKDVIGSVTFWGAADGYTWLDDFPVACRKNWPFAFDDKHEPKQSCWKITGFEA